MARSRTTWEPGQSGNPNGRPKRALTEILERAGAASVEEDGKRLSGKRFVARCLWDIAKTGKCTLADGRELVAGPDGWFDIVKFLYSQIDGPPPKDVNLGGQADNPLSIEVVWDDSGIEGGEGDSLGQDQSGS